MKKVVLSALLLAIAAAAAHAQSPYMVPLSGQYYYCTYTNTNLHEVNGEDGGFSRFDISPITAAKDWYQGREVFLATYGPDQRKVTFAKPFNVFVINPRGEEVWRGTRWEFTINPYGPQCKNTVVQNWGQFISFQNCTDGSSRYCTLY
ncbi:MAG: hypothetical protein ACJ76N_16050 [Thermoanaerobaculia bacterium]